MARKIFAAIVVVTGLTLGIGAQGGNGQNQALPASMVVSPGLLSSVDCTGSCVPVPVTAVVRSAAADIS